MIMKNEPQDEFENGLREILSPGEKGKRNQPQKTDRKEYQYREEPPNKRKSPRKVTHRTELIIRILSALIAVLLLLLFVIQTTLR